MSRRDNECFGLPNSGLVAGTVFGIIIIIWGLSILFGWVINIMAFGAIIIGALIVAGSIYQLTRKRS